MTIAFVIRTASERATGLATSERLEQAPRIGEKHVAYEGRADTCL
jgi:hypothetical protein